MAYAVVSDVTALAPGFGEFTNASKPTAGQVTSMIGAVERELDAQLKNLGYVTPIAQATSPIAYAIVKDKVAHAVLARAIRARALGVTDPNSLGADDAQAIFDNWLKALAKTADPTELPDATRTDDATVKDVSTNTHSFATDLSSTELDGDDAPVGMRQRF